VAGVAFVGDKPIQPSKVKVSTKSKQKILDEGQVALLVGRR